MNITRVRNAELGELVRVEMSIREAQQMVSVVGALSADGEE
jgi:hypothetical protein